MGNKAEMSADSRARLRLYSTNRWKKARLRFLSKPGNDVCNYCHAAPANTVDHSLGHGRDWRETFWLEEHWVACCRSCNRKRGFREDVENRRGWGYQALKGGAGASQSQLYGAAPPGQLVLSNPSQEGKPCDAPSVSQQMLRRLKNLEQPGDDSNEFEDK